MPPRAFFGSQTQALHPRYIAIEGPIHVGKSRLVEILAERVHARRILDCRDNPFLRDFYEDRSGAAFASQMYFLMQRYRLLKEFDSSSPYASTILSDFIFERDKIFAFINLGDEELRIYEQYFALLSEQLPKPDLVIYLQTTTEALMRRIEKSEKNFEGQISFDYLTEVVKAFDHFFFHYSATDLLVINTAEIDFVERNEDLNDLLHRLQQPVKGTQYYLPLKSK
ncbi:MAG: deoxynucleoside kinase [Acidobacteriia bacterium]|nr:deoxynucleoside kinase [Terriglobia bacterium]